MRGGLLVNKLDAQAKMSKAYTISRIITITFAALGAVAMIGSAIIITLYEGDWWFNLFAVYFAAIVMIVGTPYLSLLTLMWEITRHIKNKIKIDFVDVPIVKRLHRLLLGTSVAGILTFIPFFLIFLDILNGGFAIFHFVCAGIIVALYLFLGIHEIIRRIKLHSSN